MSRRESAAQDHSKISLNEACNILNITQATGKNWVRLGKIKPIAEKELLFLKSDIEALALSKKSPQKKDNKSLILRGRELYVNYVDRNSPNHAVLELLVGSFKGTKNALTALLGESAIELLVSKGLIKTSIKRKFFAAFLEGKLDLGAYAWLINDLKGAISERFLLNHAKSLPDFFLSYVPYEDTLGLIYLTLMEVSSRRDNGRYYTPQYLTDSVVSSLDIKKGRTFLDPSCGSGNFLIRLLKRGALISDLYGCDLDSFSVTLARINFALCASIADKEFLTAHILKCDAILKQHSIKADVILGNPPWGRCESGALVKRYSKILTTALKSRPCFADLFVERGLQMLKEGGVMHFVLPEALLNVNSHKDVRNLISENSEVLAVNYLGEVFHAVQCPSVILTLRKTSQKKDVEKTLVTKPTGFYEILRKRDKDDFNFKVTDEEYHLLEKIDNLPHCVKLKDHADFALGIVTGSNEGLLFNQPQKDLEGVLRGADIEAFSIKEPQTYLKFDKERFQQTAPLEFYRSSIKIVYRFIARFPICAVDTKGYLTLNSANVLIPRIESVSPFYLCAVLNSKIMRFYFEKRFHTLKVLKSQLEQVPLPIACEDTQLRIENLVKELEQKPKDLELLQKLNTLIAKIYGLSDSEYQLFCV